MRRIIQVIFSALSLALAMGARAQIPQCANNCVTIQGYLPSSSTSLSASSVSSNVAFPTAGSNLTVLVTNNGAVTAYVVAGLTNAVVATTANNPVLPGQSIWLPQGANLYLAGITATGTASLTVTSGVGTPVIVGGQVVVNNVVQTTPKPITWTNPGAPLSITASATVVAAGPTTSIITNYTASGGGTLTLNLSGGTAVSHQGVDVLPQAQYTVTNQPPGTAITGICSTSTCLVAVQSGS